MPHKIEWSLRRRRRHLRLRRQAERDAAFPQHRGCGIFVESSAYKITSSVGATYSYRCRSYGAGFHFGFVNYKDSAPTALKHFRVLRVFRGSKRLRRDVAAEVRAFKLNALQGGVGGGGRGA